MNKKLIAAYILQVPIILVVIISFGASWYAASKGISGITYGSSILLGLIILAFVIGRWLEYKENK